MIPISYNIRSLAARKSATAATAVGMGLVVFVFASVMMLSQGITDTLKSSASPDNVIVIRKGSQVEMQSGLEDSTASLLKNAPEVARDEKGNPISAAELMVLVTLPSKAGVSNVAIRGVVPESFLLRPKVKLANGRMLKWGTDEVVVGGAIAKQLAGLEVGQPIRVKANRSVTVVGVFTADGSGQESEVWGDYATVAALFGRQGVASSVTMKLKDPGVFEELKTRMAADPRLGLDVKREVTYHEEQSEGLSMFIYWLGIIIAVFFSIGAMIGAMITMYAQIAQRVKEIGTLRALGFQRRSILLSFLLESVLLAVGGGLLGVAGALAMGFVEFTTVNFATFSQVVFHFTATPQMLVNAMLFAVGMGLVGGFFPAIRAARVMPAQAMRS